MLEVKNLSKTYSTKKGVQTRALDNVTIRFPETGLVFLLGKSGSGKSTLLNLCGGLDSADSGEIIIMGKSSRDFSATDFDSYRNTFVGFVFQEYNILEEFTVEDNIALALELQNKKRDNGKIDEILKSVELEDFAKRKPNTLSGGQKQRVAIARALVKNPRIILADEPTGALDSETGKQVLETLKKLSADKLVIVVSHDREFAESYADRIIELKDGKIISDRLIGQNGVAKENVIRSYTSEEQTMIRSRLPVRYAFRMGVASIRQKPVRLVFTIFLCFVAFVAFGLFSSIMFYNEQVITEQTFANSDISFLNYQKAYRSNYTVYRVENGEKIFDSTGETIESTGMTETEFSALTARYPGSIAAVSFMQPVTGLNIDETSFYLNMYQGFAFAYGEPDVQLLAGRFPQSSDEGIISDYTFACMQYGTLFDGDGAVILISYDDYAKIPVQYVCDYPVKIVGVYKAENVPEKYKELKDSSDRHEYTQDRGYNWQNDELINGFYSYLIVNYSFSDVYIDYVAEHGIQQDLLTYKYFFASDVNATLSYEDDNIQNFGYLSTYDKSNGKDLIQLYDLAGTNKINRLNNGEMAVSVNTYAYIVLDYLHAQVNDKYNELIADGKWDEYIQLQNAYYDIENEIDALSRGEVSDIAISRQYLRDILSFLQEWSFDLSQLKLKNNYGAEQNVEISGLFFEYDGYNCAYLAQDLFDLFYKSDEVLYNYEYSTLYAPANDGYIQSVFIGESNYKNALHELVAETLNVNGDDSTVVFGNYLMFEISRVHGTMHGMRWLSLGLWLGFTLFAVLLLFNFISASITAKKKEIGIMRAIGARSMDVFKIFLSEAMVITAVCLALSVVGCVVLCPVISAAIIEGSSIGVTILVYTPLTFLFMLCVSIFTAIVSTAIPVAIYTQKPPVDSIRSL